jgi:hypothetical protein
VLPRRATGVWSGWAWYEVAAVQAARCVLDTKLAPRAWSDVVVGCKCLESLVDLVRFELTTSSMPFKKYQSLADISTRNKRLSTSPRGLRWTPQGTFWVSGLHVDSRTPHPDGTSDDFRAGDEISGLADFARDGVAAEFAAVVSTWRWPIDSSRRSKTSSIGPSMGTRPPN